MKVSLDGQSLTIEQIVSVARLEAKVELSNKGKKNLEKCRKFIEEMVEERRTYVWCDHRDRRVCQDSDLKRDG